MIRPITPEIAKLLINKEYIPAIKEYRRVYSTELKDSKQAIDSVRDNMPLLHSIINSDCLGTAILSLEDIAKGLLCTYPQKSIEVISLIIKLKEKA
jgi:hypothetical protein